MAKEKHPFPVCKPCWELNYCPYGPLVEFFPLPSEGITQEFIETEYDKRFAELSNMKLENNEDFWYRIQQLEFLNPRRWEEIFRYDYDDLKCNVFGHVCPVFFTAEKFTESSRLRDTSKKRYIPREILLKVVRRDGQICQQCKSNVLDTELHLDHIIPLSKGGPTSVDNLRVLCEKCNLSKSDKTDGI